MKHADKIVHLLGDVKQNQAKMISEVTDHCEKKLAKKCKIAKNEFERIIEQFRLASPEEVAAMLEE